MTANLEQFIQSVKFTPAGNPSKKDVNRFLIFCILLSGEYDGHLFTINLKPYNDIAYILWRELRASHYYTFEKISTRTYTFMPTKPIRQNLLCKNNKLCIKKKTIVYMKKPLIQELFDRLQIKSLRQIDKHLKKRGFSDTSCKVLKQGAFEFIPLHQAYTKSYNVDEHSLTLELNKWIVSKPWVVKRMIRRKFGYLFPKVTFSLEDSSLRIESEELTGKTLLTILRG